MQHQTRWFILTAVSLVIVFVWTGVRPAATGMYCHRFATNKASTGAGQINKDRYDGYFDMCRNRWGV